MTWVSFLFSIINRQYTDACPEIVPPDTAKAFCSKYAADLYYCYPVKDQVLLLCFYLLASPYSALMKLYVHTCIPVCLCSAAACWPEGWSVSVAALLP
jgi:hypothetical protein